MITEKTAFDLKPVLMKGAKIGVKNPYYEIEEKEQIIFVVTPGRNGIEFNKTLGYFSLYPSMQAYQCLFGQGILLMQRNDSYGAKEFKVVILNPNRQVLVPAGWGVGFVNTGSSLLVIIRNSNIDKKYLDIKPLIEKQGFAYYVVEKRGEIAFEQNPNYSVHPQITTE